jgi:hypothetical protein
MAVAPEDKLIDLLRNAQRWNENGKDYIPTFGCSSCGKGCMPLCGVGVEKNIRQMETKDLIFQTRKTMLETGRPAATILMQVVTGTGMVVRYEEALQCMEEIRTKDGNTCKVFTKPIPTMCGLLCRDCELCQICGKPTEDQVFMTGGRAVRACCFCTDTCPSCKKLKVKHNLCCQKKRRIYS